MLAASILILRRLPSASRTISHSTTSALFSATAGAPVVAPATPAAAAVLPAVPPTSAPAAPSSPSSSAVVDLPSTGDNGGRIRALSLYRKILRGAERMPTPNRQNYIKRRARSEFRRNATLTDTEEIDFEMRLADTNLDTVLVQAEHLSRLFSDPEYQNYN